MSLSEMALLKKSICISPAASWTVLEGLLSLLLPVALCLLTHSRHVWKDQ